MSEQEIRDMNKLDDLSEKAGGFVTPLVDSKVQYDYRKISQYCKEKGIEPVDMTIRELSNYIIEQ